MTRLDAIRGRTPGQDHNARSIAALAANPACDRRAILDAAAIDKPLLMKRLRFDDRWGQSPFAIQRNQQFTDLVKVNGAAHLLRLLRGLLDLPIEEAGYVNLEDAGGNEGHAARHGHTRRIIRQTAEGRGRATILDRPLLRLDVAGARVYLEPDVIAFQLGGMFHIVAIKSFAILDDQADTPKVSAAAREAAVYVHALRDLVGADLVSHDVILVCPKDFTNEPTATTVDVRHQLVTLARQLSRLTRIDAILDRLPEGFSLDLDRLSPGEIEAAVAAIPARYAPQCLSACELSHLCRKEAHLNEQVDALGRVVRDDLGGIESVTAALRVATPGEPVAGDQAEIAERLRHVARIYDEAVA